jgi:hypothetical protein
MNAYDATELAYKRGYEQGKKDANKWMTNELAIALARAKDPLPDFYRKKGRWDKPVEHGLPFKANHLGVVCSYCCSWSDNDYNYCPNCGAKMDGDGNEID